MQSPSLNGFICCLIFGGTVLLCLAYFDTALLNDSAFELIYENFLMLSFKMIPRTLLFNVPTTVFSLNSCQETREVYFPKC